MKTEEYTAAHKKLIYERAYHEQSMSEQDKYERAWSRAAITMDLAFARRNWKAFDAASEDLDLIIYDHYMWQQKEKARRDDHQ